MNDSGQMMPYQELWERLKQVTGERNRLGAELAALEANPPLAEVEGWVPKTTKDIEFHVFSGNFMRGVRLPGDIDVTVTIRGKHEG